MEDKNKKKSQNNKTENNFDKKNEDENNFKDKKDDKLLVFLYSSIADIQNTIRSVDTKIGFLLVALGIPVSTLGKIFKVLLTLYSQATTANYKIFFWIFIATFLATWLMSFCAALMALISISDPQKQIRGYIGGGGSYFCGGQFSFNFFDRFVNRAWFNKKGTSSKDDIIKVVSKLPSETSLIIFELVFEQMKLSYIRDMKIYRQNTAYICAAIWLGLGFIAWMMVLLLKS